MNNEVEFRAGIRGREDGFKILADDSD